MSTSLMTKTAFETKLFPEESRARIILGNGWQISVAWGSGMHGSNYDAPMGVPINYDPDFRVEALCFDPEGEMVYSNGDVYANLRQDWIRDVLIPWVAKPKDGERDLPDQPWD